MMQTSSKGTLLIILIALVIFFLFWLDDFRACKSPNNPRPHPPQGSAR